jgi:hypothetical protein
LRGRKETPSIKRMPRMTMPEPSMLSGCPQQYIIFRTIPAIGTAASATTSLVIIRRILRCSVDRSRDDPTTGF